MSDHLTRRSFGKATAATAMLAVSRAWTLARAATPEEKTLRFIAQANLRILDPIWTTAYITRNHGYMVFDTLFAIDSEFVPHPQMVGDYDLSPDKLTYRFKLRDGLAFHDGSPVRSVDCVASIRRWAARDALGQWLVPLIDTIAADGHPAVVCDAGAAFQHGSLPAGHRDGRVGSVQICQRGVRTGPPGGLSEEHRLCAAQRAAKLGVGRQGGQGRSGRMAQHPRRDDPMAPEGSGPE